MEKESLGCRSEPSYKIRKESTNVGLKNESIWETFSHTLRHLNNTLSKAKTDKNLSDEKLMVLFNPDCSYSA